MAEASSMWVMAEAPSMWVMAEASSMWERAIDLGAGAAVLNLLNQCYPDDGVVLETWSD